MKVDLDRGLLESIVIDEVRELQLGLVVSKRCRKGAWFRRVLDEIMRYEKSMRNKFIKVVIEDFGGAKTLKVKKGRINDEELENLKEFADMIKDSDDSQYKNKLKEEMRIMVEELRSEEIGLQTWLKMVEDCHEQILWRMELKIRSVIFQEMGVKTDEKIKLGTKIYNFTEIEMTEEMKKLFLVGVDAIPSTSMSEEQVKKSVEMSLLNYLKNYRNRRRRDIIEQENIMKWLRVALEREERRDDEDLVFYTKVLEGYKEMMNEMMALHAAGKIKLDNEKALKHNLNINGSIIVPCDKNLGMSVFPLEVMREADAKLMEQMGARKLKATKTEVIKEVFDDIAEFEQGLDDEQKNYMDYAFRDRVVQEEDVVFPFLKSTHKIQKMTQIEIEKKDLSSLKFRPVIDAKRWVSRGYATLAMRMMRKAVKEVLDISGPVLSKMKVKNGWSFSKLVQEHLFEEKYGVMVSADLEEAYTNVDMEMINSSIGYIGKILSYPVWRINLMKKLIKLVLSNNFVETSVGVFKFGEVLPMGYRLSGEALDIVAISGEVTKMMNLGKGNSDMIGMPVGELMDYPEEFSVNSVQYENKIARSIKDYKRYVDDTHCIIRGEEVRDIVDGLLAIGFMFPSGLTISLELNIFKSEFLDVTSWRGLRTKEVSTMMKRNHKVPFGHIKRRSGHPDRFKLKTLLGEMLRNRRIASDGEIVVKVDECICKDFVSIGYSFTQVNSEMANARQRIQEKYSEFYCRITDDEITRKFMFCGGIVFNKNYDHPRILSEFLVNCKPEWAPKIAFMPGTKLKNLAYTKRNYLKRQHEDIEKSEFKLSRK